MADLENDRVFLERRKRESLEAAAKARDPGIARIYRDFARRYQLSLEERGRYSGGH